MDTVMDVAGDERIRELVRDQSVPRLFARTVQRLGDSTALRWKDGNGDWSSWTWREYAERARRTAALLESAGVGRGDHVALMMRNRAEFHPIDMGAYLAGAAPFSIYNSSSPEQIEYLLTHSEAKLLFVEDGFAPAARAVIDDRALDVAIVVVGGPAGSTDAPAWHEAIASVAPVELDEAAGRVAPNDLATLIYTSGTTGPPKAVMLSHANICWLLESLTTVLGVDMEGRRMLSYLPMAHVAERVFTHYLPSRTGASVTCCPNPADVGAYLPDVQPEAFFGPPRIFEKMRASLIGALSATEAGAAALENGLEAGRQMFAARIAGVSPSAATLDAWRTADEAMFAGIRERIGLGACRAALTGAAPPPPEVIEFFNFIGIPLTEVYGLSEDTGLMTADVRQPRIGAVGRPIPGCSVRLLDDGEVLCSGGHVFQGYFKDPEKTAEVLDDQGWLHTGDIGTFDDDGYLRIVDRKKELIITAGGKNISPANIEAHLKQIPLVAEACAIGDRRPYVTAILTLDAETARSWAAQQGLGELSPSELANRPEIRDEIERGVATMNERLSNVERIKKFHLSESEWLPDSDVLTPTMKLKRRGVVLRYADEIDALY